MMFDKLRFNYCSIPALYIIITYYLSSQIDERIIYSTGGENVQTLKASPKVWTQNTKKNKQKHISTDMFFVCVCVCLCSERGHKFSPYAIFNKFHFYPQRVFPPVNSAIIAHAYFHIAPFIFHFYFSVFDFAFGSFVRE